MVLEREHIAQMRNARRLRMANAARKQRKENSVLKTLAFNFLGQKSEE